MENHLEESDSDGTHIQVDTSPRESATTSRRKSIPKKNFSEHLLMFIFERRINLSNYKEGTPLYPLARAWYSNNPNRHIEHRLFAPPSIEDNATELLEQAQRGELSHLTNMPLPLHTNLPAWPPALDWADVDEEHSPKWNTASHEELLSHHLYRWKHIKVNWQCYRWRYKEARYGINRRILEMMYMPTCEMPMQMQ